MAVSWAGGRGGSDGGCGVDGLGWIVAGGAQSLRRLLYGEQTPIQRGRQNGPPFFLRRKEVGILVRRDAVGSAFGHGREVSGPWLQLLRRERREVVGLFAGHCAWLRRLSGVFGGPPLWEQWRTDGFRLRWFPK